MTMWKHSSNASPNRTCGRTERSIGASSEMAFMLVLVRLSMALNARQLRTRPDGNSAQTNHQRKPLELPVAIASGRNKGPPLKNRHQIQDNASPPTGSACGLPL